MATVAVPDSASQRSDAEDSLLLPFDVAKYDGAAVNEGSEDGDEPPVKKYVQTTQNEARIRRADDARTMRGRCAEEGGGGGKGELWTDG